MRYPARPAPAHRRRGNPAAWPRRLAVTLLLAIASSTVMVTGIATPAFAGSLVSPGWSVSDTAPGTQGADYTYTFTTASTSELDSVTMTVPAGTGGFPAAGTVTPAGLADGGSVTMSGGVLTYSFTPGTVDAGTAVSIEITGLANTTVAGSYTSDIATVDTGTPVDSGTAPAVSFSGALVSPEWAVSTAAPGAAGVDYTYTLTAASTSVLDSVTMTVPAGTGGSPAVGVVTPAGVTDGGSVSLSGGTLTYSFTPGLVAAGTTVSIEITGLANTSTAGSYTSDITTVAADTPVDSGTTPAVSISGTLVGPEWAVSDTAPGGTGVDYTYTFTAASTSVLDSVTMTVPVGTGGSPAVGVVTPAAVADGGSVSLSGGTLTYSFTPGLVAAGTTVSIEITGLTNTTVAGSYTSDITTVDAGTPVDSGTTPGVAFGGSLTQLEWVVSDSAPAATGVHYTYTFTAASSSELDSVTMTVPVGTGGSPVVGVVTPAAVADGGSVSLSGGTLTYSFTPGLVAAGTTVSIEITGLTNTSTAGSYTSVITTQDVGSGVDSGTTPGVGFPGTLTLASPSSLAWAAEQNGTDQSSVDETPADQKLTVNDSSGTASGWDVTVSATTFSSGSHTLPDTSRLEFNGSTSSLTGAAPSAACVGSCVLPVDTTTYPVAIDTAASSPDAFTIYDASAGTGTGVVALGGSSATHPIGWWIQVPASAYAGSYTSTLTLTLVSGPGGGP
jgi:WxL domain surface cell wall-binding